MTATVLSNTDTELFKAVPVTFVLAGHSLITIRYTRNPSVVFQIRT
jgi:hypothetical protein